MRTKLDPNLPNAIYSYENMQVMLKHAREQTTPKTQSDPEINSKTPLDPVIVDVMTNENLTALEVANHIHRLSPEELQQLRYSSHRTGGA